MDKENFLRGGVTSVSYHEYNLQIVKAKMFEWEEIIPLVIFVLREEFSPEADLEEIKPPLRSVIDREGYQHYLPEKVPEVEGFE